MSEKYSLSCCIDCPFLNEFSAYDWGDYGCKMSQSVSGEMKSEQIEAGVPDNCPLYDSPITIVLETKEND